MAKTKKTKSWDLEATAEVTPTPPPAVETTSAPEPASDARTRPVDRAAATPPPARVPLSTYVPPEVRWELRELALRLSRERGVTVSVADLATEALTDLLRRYR